MASGNGNTNHSSSKKSVFVSPAQSPAGADGPGAAGKAMARAWAIDDGKGPRVGRKPNQPPGLNCEPGLRLLVSHRNPGIQSQDR